MGMTLELFTADENDGGHSFPRRFMDDILFWGKYDECLSQEEQNIILPNSFGEIHLKHKRGKTLWNKIKLLAKAWKMAEGQRNRNSISVLYTHLKSNSQGIKDRERDAKLLKSALEKVQQYWYENAEYLPVVHYVYSTKECILHRSITSVMINGMEVVIDGDLSRFDNSLRDKIHIKSYGDNHGKSDFYIIVTPEIILGEQIFYTQTVSKIEVYKEIFDDIYAFLDEVIALDKKVLWEFG